MKLSNECGTMTEYSTVVNDCYVMLMSVCSGDIGIVIDDIQGNKPFSPLGQATVPSIFWVQMFPPT